MNELALFAGAGGGILGGHLLGWRTICAVERDAYAAQVLAQRQNDGILPAFPIWSDVCSFDGKPWRGIVDVISGGFPCQDISSAGRGAGITGERSGLWKEFARIIGEVRPRYVFVENSPMLTKRGIDIVLGDLAAMGFNAEWGIVSARASGAPHKRERLWIVADANMRRLYQHRSDKENNQSLFDGTRGCRDHGKAWSRGADHANENRQRGNPWANEPGLDRVADGVAHRVDRIKALGNGQVPIVAATAFRILSGQIK